MHDPYLYVGAGLLVGIMVGLTGVGGGSLMTPNLMLVFGQSPANSFRLPQSPTYKAPGPANRDAAVIRF